MYNYGYNPYQQQFNPNFQSPQYQQPRGLSGRMVDDISTVGANEVNLDGTPSIFVKRDLSEVYIKRWNQNGMIDTSCYRLYIPEVVKAEPKENEFVLEDSIKSLQAALLGIDEKIDRVIASPQTKTKVPSKKEVEL